MRRMRGVAIFLLVIGVYTLGINSWNAKYFGLQAATITGLVEHGDFGLVDQVFPGFNLVQGDETFRYNKKIYPMKQPGQTVLGALIYKPLTLINWRMTNHYDFVIHIITLLTSTIMMAGTTVMLYLLAYKLSKNTGTALITACVFAFGTIIWPYAGVMHHDIYATFFAFVAVAYYLVSLDKENSSRISGWSGIFAGLTLFFSMLPVTLPIGLFLLIVMRKRIKLILMYLVGLLVGLLPSFAYNYSQFGNILSFPNLAGRVSDTTPLPSLVNFLNHLYFFLIDPSYSLFSYSPVLILAVIGIAVIPRKYYAWKRAIIFLSLLQLVHISSQETYGGFQYGPRYLLTILPMISLGIVFYLNKYEHGLGRKVLYLALLYSFMVAVTGAFQTVMYPMPGPYGPWQLGQQIIRGELPEYRMIPIGIVITLAGALIWFVDRRREARLESTPKK